MNSLSATITSCTSSQHLSSISVAVKEDSFHLLLAEVSNAEELLHTSVTLVFKETEVILLKVFTPTTANIQHASVQHIERGIILTQITLSYFDISITALVTTLTFDTLQISEGDDIYWMIQPSEISLLRGSNGI